MSVNIQVAPPWYREGTELLAEADRGTCSAGAVLAEGRDEVIAEQILAAINGTQPTLHRVGVEILNRLTNNGWPAITLRDAGLLLRDEIENDVDAVQARYGVMSTGEKVVALALLYRADHAATADNWAETDLKGFLTALSYTGGAHKRAALQLLGA